MAHTAVPDHEVLIIGGGLSGIGAAIMLDRAGFSDYLLIEEGDGFGGAWHWNTYPGVGVDIPSFAYQFSFEQVAGWSRIYAPGAELKAYAEHCVDKYDVRRRSRLCAAVVAADYLDSADLWEIRLDDGTTVTGRYVISATGVLTKPKKPEIDGVDDFAGTTMHTARWDDEVDLTGKQVAIIGTGASAVQIIPSIAPRVDSLTVFQRTPIWCLPKPDAPLPGALRTGLRMVPGSKAVARLASQLYVEVTFPLAAHFHGLLPAAKAGEQLGYLHLKRSVRDPQVRQQLTPQYSLGCKRPSFSNTYLRTFNRDNVHLETRSIEAITADGVRTVDGVERPVDVLILATGFKVFDKGNMPPYPVTGTAGRGLEEFWTQNRFQAYHGVSVPSFPNYFMILGPYGYNGSSYFNLIETQTNHVIRLLTEARTRGSTRVEVTAEANADYFEKVLGRRGNQVFFQGDCGGANSYYFDDNGDVPLRPSPTLETMWDARRFPLTDYRFESVAHRTEPNPVQ
ncbi:putative flavin-containing monooxygenase [Gordonia hirsuta DSM 44140 = NBRC 16056]|uniref:Putative flavin-containing monooxygenase n=1 Tax=Gordonia hirsuta DSM 44140 = NBRC 16056 TaxID=1121927 RepID=L7L965_9ACTN|nr:NAD(P)/FAD-dependent oxidoreductase [Gordonia hirsuta]GAC57690.1 putative flavin-containing monooxygenase [Gordonia hirsuta DSM 44140 = NBRC 16056]